jgi:hypothetical protein
VCLIVAVIVPYYAFFNSYSAYKVGAMWDLNAIQGDESGQVRLMGQEILLERYLASTRTICLGVGWGQSRYLSGGDYVQASAGELINALAYGGIPSAVFYLLYTLYAFRSCLGLARANLSIPGSNRLQYYGLALAIFAGFIRGQLNGAFIAPEYWMMLGMAIYCDFQLHNLPRPSKRIGDITREQPK